VIGEETKPCDSLLNNDANESRQSGGSKAILKRFERLLNDHNAGLLVVFRKTVNWTGSGVHMHKKR
jgi:hypothetical protein